jgi:hypothetical protein
MGGVSGSLRGRGDALLASVISSGAHGWQQQQLFGAAGYFC